MVARIRCYRSLTSAELGFGSTVVETVVSRVTLRPQMSGRSKIEKRLLRCNVARPETLMAGAVDAIDGNLVVTAIDDDDDEDD